MKPGYTRQTNIRRRFNRHSHCRAFVNYYEGMLGRARGWSAGTVFNLYDGVPFTPVRLSNGEEFFFGGYQSGLLILAYLGDSVRVAVRLVK